MSIGWKKFESGTTTMCIKKIMEDMEEQGLNTEQKKVEVTFRTTVDTQKNRQSRQIDIFPI